MIPESNRRRWLQHAGVGVTGLLAPALHAHPETEPKTSRLLAALQTSQDTTKLAVEMRPGCIRFRKAGETKWAGIPGLLNRNAGLSSKAQELGWHVLTGNNEISVPSGKLEYEAFADINSNLAKGTIDTAKQNRLKIDLKNLFNPEDSWMVPGNTHLHLRKMTRQQVVRYLTEIPRADGLKVVFVSYLERALQTKTYSSNEFTKTELEKLNQAGLKFGNGEEYRHNFGPGAEGYGHVMLLDIAKRILPASVGPGITLRGNDSTPLSPGIRLAKDDGATVIWCHNTFGYEDIPNWLGGHVDAQNIFDGGNRNGYEETFYRYLNLGTTVPFSTGTDWFMYDFSRTYVPISPDDERTPQLWLKRLKKGSSIITNGTWLELDINSADPGDTLVYARPRALPIKARAIGRNDFGKIELVRNGEVVAEANSVARGDRFEAKLDIRHKLTEPEWWALRIAHPNAGRNELNQPLFAHTSPIYIDYQDKRVFDRKTAQSLVDEMEQSIKSIRRFGKFANKAEEEGVLSIYRQAITQLKSRL
tara:strand:- start:9192 stop:10787 length:1596 start_codon:yes stop_codon:yes gene_type:complete